MQSVTIGLRMASGFAGQVANRIRELREARGLSVRELARRSGLPPESVSRSERGISEITLTSLNKLCAGLTIDLPTFFTFAKKPDSYGIPTPDVRRIVALLTGLEREQRSKIVRGIEQLLGGIAIKRR